MKKISISLICIFIFAGAAHAQGTFLYNSTPTGTTVTTTPSVQVLQYDPTGQVGIGFASSLVAGGNLPGALNVGNKNFATVGYPGALIVSANMVQGTDLSAAAASPYNILSLRTDNTSDQNALSIDFVVDGYGLVGIGNFPGKGDVASGIQGNGNISAHLYVTDANNDGLPLIASYSNGGVMGMIVDKNGLVGIGNYPTIGGTTPLSSVIPGNGNTNAHLYITDPASDGYPLLTAYTNANTPALLLNSSGYLGIGTATPTNPLEVSGNAVLHNNLVVEQNFVTLGQGSVSGSFDAGSTVTVAGSITAASTLNVAGSISAASTLTVAGSISAGSNVTIAGTVQIGANKPVSSTYTPFALSVDGNIVARKVMVETSDWADYVFDKSYKLKSLSDVEAYISQNKHLPNVPSECEAIDNGQDIGEMNKVLLQKVEELTLYLIQQQKEIDALKNK